MILILAKIMEIILQKMVRKMKRRAATRTRTMTMKTSMEIPVHLCMQQKLIFPWARKTLNVVLNVAMSSPTTFMSKTITIYE